METGTFSAAAGNVAIADFASCGVKAEDAWVRRGVRVVHQLEGTHASTGLCLCNGEKYEASDEN